MMCLVDFADGEISGWIIGTDAHDVRRQVEANSWSDDTGRLQRVAGELYVREFFPPGRHELPTGHSLLVS